jgi:putative acetyltransferase
MDSFFIRNEQPQDISAVFAVNLEAFAHDSEARLVDALRNTGEFDPELSLVAVHNDRIIGHILFPAIVIETSEGDVPALALSPLVVHPEFQCRGAGSALIEEGLNVCREYGHRIVVVIGHPGYYPKFGFVPATEHGIRASFPVDDKVFMALALVPGALDTIRGIVKYSEPFHSIVGYGDCIGKKVNPALKC